MKNPDFFRKVVIFGIMALLIITAFVPLIDAGNYRINSGENISLNQLSFTHTVLGEEATATWCGYCPTVMQIMDNIYNSGQYDFEYVTLVCDKNSYALSRYNELGNQGYPCVMYDGDYTRLLGAGYTQTDHENAIQTCGARSVANIDLDLTLFWLGNNQISISIEVTNNGGSTYNGHLHVYITEKNSRWYNSGLQYHYAMIGNYGINQNINVGASSTETYTNTWTSPYSDITMGNIKGIASVFSNSYTDETATANPQLPNSDPPTTPSQPAGPSSGIVGIPNTFSTSSTEPNGDSIRYGWDWDNDNDVDYWTDYYSSGATAYVDHTWNSPGNYNIKVKAEDLFGTQSVWSSSKSIQITTGSPPNTPSMPSGETDGMHNTQYTYTTGTTDPNTGDELYYLFDWGDGTDSGWKGPYEQGQSASANHKWSDSGSFDVKVKAKDLAGSETDWSPALNVFMGNTAPNRPNKPSGPPNGIILQTYTYSTSASDPEGDSLKYKFDWDDGTDSGWVSTKYAGHSWSEEGTYSVRVKAKDDWDESIWSAPLTVEILSGDLDVSPGGPYESKTGNAISFTGSVAGGIDPYSWEWNFGDGESAFVQNPTHTYSIPGDYTVTLLVSDNEGSEGIGTTTAVISSNPPDTPTITGKRNGAAGVEQTYIISSADPDNDDVYYYIEWGDDSTTDWQGPYSSGVEQNFNHTFTEKGDYEIRVKAKDTNDLESDWGSITVSMPKQKSATNILNYLFEQFFKRYPLLHSIITTLFKYT